MKQIVQHHIAGNTFTLSNDRCVFWEEEKMLLLSDLHFGKTGHFRKEGIAVPQDIYKEDLQLEKRLGYRHFPIILFS